MPILPSTDSKIRVLIVDDEVAQMRALCDTLRDHDYETVGYTSGKLSLEALQNEKFDLLVSDLMMPEMSGIALLQAALAIDPNLGCIIMTGEGSIASAVEAMKIGALDYILKPFKLSGILPVLSRAVNIRQLRIANIALEQQLRERAAELEVTNRELESFSYSVAHDLRAPLRSICSFSGLLQSEHEKELSLEGQRVVNTIIRNAHHMERLINDLLHFSHVVRHPLSKTTVNVALLIQQAVEELRREESNRQVEVMVDNMPDCVADPALIRQVFINLLSNAFKYTRKSTNALVQIGHYEDKDTRQQVYFISDNGTGFDMKYVDKLFRVFERLHSVKDFEGTGVGLSIVQRIVERHGGRVWAEGKMDKGATFYFSLPG